MFFMILQRKRSRLGRTLSNLGLHGLTAKRLRRIRRLDQSAFAGRNPNYPVSTGIRQYGRFFAVDFYAVIERLLRRKPKARILEIGAGKGVFLRQSKAEFGNRVETIATGLKRPPETKGIDSYRVVRLSKPVQRRPLVGEFDLIVSVSGELQVMGPKAIVLNVLSKLALGGRAFLDLGVLRLAHGKVGYMESEYARVFEENGFRVRKILNFRPREALDEVSLMELERVQ
jgi:hypothetical protein